MNNTQEIGLKSKNGVYTIAEIGINHGGDLSKAKALIDSAARAGVDAVKFQTYLTDKRAPKGNDDVYKILKKCEFPFEVFSDLKSYAEKYKIDFFSTPFDSESVEYLESINCDLYKIASFDVTNHELLREVAKTQKPVIMSVGMANIDEIKDAYRILKEETDRIAILHCISAYPTLEKDSNLNVIHKLKKEFDCVIGHSDHTPDILVPLYAIAAGAQIVEKHFKIDSTMECVDSEVSITELQMRKLTEETRRLKIIMGNDHVDAVKAEEGTKIFRRHTSLKLLS